MKARLLLIISIVLAGLGVRGIAAESFTKRTPNGVKLECVYDSWSDSYFVIFSKWKSIFVVPYSVCPDMERNQSGD